MSAYIVAISIVALIYMLLALGLTLQFGLTGLINFGHVGFFAIGAYTSALLALQGVPLPLSFLAAAILSGLTAWPIGLISLRLRDDYFAIVTLGFSEVVRIVITNARSLTDGTQGIPGIPRLYPGLTGLTSQLAVLATVGVVTLAAIWMIVRIARSPFGRMIQAIRDNEVAVKALGKDPARFKVQVLAVGAALAGIAGAFYAHYITYITPDQFIPLVTFYVWMAIIMGGASRISGAVLGTVILMVFLEGSRFIHDFLPGISDVSMASARIGIVGLLLIVFVIKRPQGLMGDTAQR
ncbi:MAG: branched-chain amino acid ABC transporter permease [Acetobacteraceae bacterium]